MATIDVKFVLVCILAQLHFCSCSFNFKADVPRGALLVIDIVGDFFALL